MIDNRTALLAGSAKDSKDFRHVVGDFGIKVSGYLCVNLRPLRKVLQVG